MSKLISIKSFVSISNKSKYDLFTNNFMTLKSYEFKILNGAMSSEYENYF